MHFKIKKKLESLDLLIERERGLLQLNLDEIEQSAMTSWVEDCHQSFLKIYQVYLQNILTAKPDDYETIHENIVDMYWELQHVKNHITDSEKGLTELMKILAEKSDKDEPSG